MRKNRPAASTASATTGPASAQSRKPTTARAPRNTIDLAQIPSTRYSAFRGCNYLTRRRTAERKSGGGGEAVAGAAHGLDQAIVAARLERLAQPPDVDIHRALLDEDVVAPHLVEKLRARVNALGVSHQEMQQPEFRRAEREGGAVAAYPVTARIEREAGDVHGIVGRLRRPASQHRL